MWDGTGAAYHIYQADIARCNFTVRVDTAVEWNGVLLVQQEKLA